MAMLASLAGCQQLITRDKPNNIQQVSAKVRHCNLSQSAAQRHHRQRLKGIDCDPLDDHQPQFLILTQH